MTGGRSWNGWVGSPGGRPKPGGGDTSGDGGEKGPPGFPARLPPMWWNPGGCRGLGGEGECWTEEEEGGVLPWGRGGWLGLAPPPKRGWLCEGFPWGGCLRSSPLLTCAANRSAWPLTLPKSFP